MISGPVVSMTRSGSNRGARYPINHASISLHVYGYKFYRVDDRMLSYPKKPFLVILPPGVEVEFAAISEDRLSWSIQMQSDDIRRCDDNNYVEVCCDEHWIRIPAVTFISRAESRQIEADYQRLFQLYQTPIPSHQLRMRLGFAKLLRFIMDADLDIIKDTPASRMKRLIDKDLQGKHSLDELSKQCGYSTSHMRALFKEEYTISPLAYQNRARMNKALDMLQHSDLAIKDIADNLGFQQLSHFSRMFKQIHGIAPSKIERHNTQ